MLHIKYKNKKLKNLLLTLILILVFTLSESLAAKTKKQKVKKKVKEISYNLTFSLNDNLVIFKGKHIRVLLSSGQILSGKLKDVGRNLIHLEKLSDGRSYYDALIRIEDISAFDTQFRGFR